MSPLTGTAIPLMTRHDALVYGITDHELYSSHYRRVLHGVYTDAEVEVTHELKCLAASLILPEDSIITGRSAATLHGVPLAAASQDVEVLVSDHKYMNRRKGLRCWARKSRQDEYTSWRGVQLATPVRATFDLLARNPLKSAVAYCDAVLHAGLVSADNIHSFFASRRYYGSKKASKAFMLVDARAESIPESVLRVTLVQGGLHPVPQVNVFDANGFVGRLDLAFQDEKVAVEYDGAWHGDSEQARRDQIRRDRLRAAGWYVIVVTADQMNDPAGIVARVHATLQERRRL